MQEQWYWEFYVLHDFAELTQVSLGNTAFPPADGIKEQLNSSFFFPPSASVTAM